MAAQDTWQILEDVLYQLVLGNMPASYVDSGGTHGGSMGTVLAVQPNPDGTTGLQYVARAVPPEVNIFPQIGLMAHIADESLEVSHSRDLTNRFDLVIAVKQPQSDTVPDTANAALQALRNYQNDGSGNGLSPLLRSNVTLLGLADSSQITRMERVVMKSESGSAEAIAMAIYTFVARTRVRTQ